MQRALTSGCHEDDLPPPHDPNHLAPPNISWLSRLSSGHRRGSMGFSEIGGTSMIDDENSNSFQGTGHGGGLVIPKSIFGGGADKSSTDIPSPGDASSFALQSTLATIRKEPSVSPEHKKKYQFLPEEPMISERPNTNQSQLSDLISTAVALKCGSDFPVATKESLEQLEEFKIYSNEHEHDFPVAWSQRDGEKEQNSDFGFEMDVDEGGQTVMPTAIVEPSMPHTLEKPPGKIMSKLMQSGFAQSWFFKKEEVTEGDESQSNSRKSSKEETMHDNDNASFQTFGVQMDSNPGPQGFVGVLQEEKRKRSKKEQREFNFMAPQNL